MIYLRHLLPDNVNSTPDTFKNPTESPPRKERNRTCICSDCICSPCLDTNKINQKKSCACKGPKKDKPPVVDTSPDGEPKVELNSKTKICDEDPEILKRLRNTETTMQDQEPNVETSSPDVNVEAKAQSKTAVEGKVKNIHCTCKNCKSKNCTCKPEIEIGRMKSCNCKVCQCKSCKDKQMGPKNEHCTCPNCKNPTCSCKPELPIIRKPCDCVQCICNPCKDPNRKQADICKPCGTLKITSQKQFEIPRKVRLSIDVPQKSTDICMNDTCSAAALPKMNVLQKQPDLVDFCTNKTCHSESAITANRKASCTNNTCQNAGTSALIPCDCPICKCLECKDKSIPPYKQPCAAKPKPYASTGNKCACKNCICPTCVDPLMRMKSKYPCSCDY